MPNSATAPSTPVLPVPGWAPDYLPAQVAYRIGLTGSDQNWLTAADRHYVSEPRLHAVDPMGVR